MSSQCMPLSSMMYRDKKIAKAFVIIANAKVGKKMMQHDCRVNKVKLSSAICMNDVGMDISFYEKFHIVLFAR